MSLTNVLWVLFVTSGAITVFITSVKYGFLSALLWTLGAGVLLHFVYWGVLILFMAIWDKLEK